MLTLDIQTELVKLYQQYNLVIKPLIAEIEARMEQFPLPLFNEIRALHDHIARCYMPGMQEKRIKEEIEKADRHILRIVLDCYKCLNLSLNDNLTLFEKQTRNIDLTVLNNGIFYPQYKKMKRETVRMVREAKKLEAINIVDSLDMYQKSYNQYSLLEDLIDSISSDVHWARIRFSIRRILNITLWLLAAILSGLLSMFITNDSIRHWIEKVIG